MEERVAIGIFEDKGTAEHACGRLKLEGVSESDVRLEMLKEVGPIPRTMAPELEVLSIDPFFWLLEAIGGDYAQFIRNGETVVCVRADSPGRIRRVCEVMQWYGPVKIEVVGRSRRAKSCATCNTPIRPAAGPVRLLRSRHRAAARYGVIGNRERALFR